ncbi:hypothetical protein GCM10018785_33990 [Streptomyces longispororuber]|uniref:Uncharacterized protein n=1 Tax=Streptomyces longispororuber TaxID=68230 RepID=A0A918ZN83_9ACTN|nr:hypothetical protein GCM10018785_33990 [Streptomyces longispororuber]
MLFLFDGGPLPAQLQEQIRLQRSEIKAYAFHNLADIASLTTLTIPRLTRRVRAAVGARADGQVAYLGHGQRPEHRPGLTPSAPLVRGPQELTRHVSRVGPGFYSLSGKRTFPPFRIDTARRRASVAAPRREPNAEPTRASRGGRSRAVANEPGP